MAEVRDPSRQRVGADSTSLLQRLRRIKTRTFLAILLSGVVSCYALYKATAFLPPALQWLPYKALAETMFTVLVVNMGLELWLDRETEGRIRDVFTDEFGKFRESSARTLARGIVLDSQLMEDVLSEEMKDRALKSVLAAKYGAPAGDVLLRGLMSRVGPSTSTMSDYKCNITLADVEESDVPAEIRRDYFAAVISLRFTQPLQSTRMLFTIHADPERQNELIDDQTCVFKWLCEDADLMALDPANESLFSVLKFRVNNKAVKLDERVRKEKERTDVFEDDTLRPFLGKDVVFDYSVRILVLKKSYFISPTIVAVTAVDELTVDFAKATGIASMRAIPHFAFLDGVVPQYRPVGHPSPHKVDVVLGGQLAFPHDGVVFVWMLKDDQGTAEAPRNAKRPRGRSGPRANKD